MPVASALLGWSAIFGPGGAVGWLVSALGGTAHNYFQEPFARWVMTVSYTHLDVYKRQVLRRSSSLSHLVFLYDITLTQDAISCTISTNK